MVVVPLVAALPEVGGFRRWSTMYVALVEVAAAACGFGACVGH